MELIWMIAASVVMLAQRLRIAKLEHWKADAEFGFKMLSAAHEHAIKDRREMK